MEITDQLFDSALFSGSDIGLGVAFLAGLVAFFSPCILPVIPAYVSYFAGVGLADLKEKTQREQRFYRHKIFRHSLLFVFGFLSIFVLLGLATGAAASLLAINKETLQRVGGVFMILLGIYLMEIFNIPWLYKQIKFDVQKKFTRFQWVNAFLTGVTFGFAWTPCIGPVLGTILFFATFAGGSTEGVILLLSFALGLGVPFIAVALGIQRFLPFIQRLGKYTAYVHKAAGVIILLMGLLLLVGWFNPILGYFIRLSTPFI
jgi:cytochrome c-type biogenesis protein